MWACYPIALLFGWFVGVVMLVFWYLVWWLLGGKGGVKEMVLSVRNCRIVGFKYSKYVLILGG